MVTGNPASLGSVGLELQKVYFGINYHESEGRGMLLLYANVGVPEVWAASVQN